MDGILRNGGEKAMNKENDRSAVIEDLPVDETQQDEVKGGQGVIGQGVITYTYTVRNTSSVD
jgi:hypothetical protein